ncbi:MAG: hypothetical protein IV090_03515 [Candidatus Sericytochromatia bacterium]|nr:hypothetical protein [Candidatus Sericytochromatia bacterium]
MQRLHIFYFCFLIVLITGCVVSSALPGISHSRQTGLGSKPSPGQISVKPQISAPLHQIPSEVLKTPAPNENKSLPLKNSSGVNNPTLIPSHSPISSAAAGALGGSPTGGSPNITPPTVVQEFLTPSIQDVLIQGNSIQAGTGSAALHPNFDGKMVELIISGHFGSAQLTDVAAVLNNDIHFKPTSISPQQLTLELDTKWIPDLYLAGPHKLRLRIGANLLQIYIVIGAPDTPLILFPEINAVNLKGDNTLEIIGKYFMRNPFFSELRLNQDKLNIISVSNDGNNDVLIAEAPSELANEEHQLIYSTPFGNTRFRFNP